MIPFCVLSFKDGSSSSTRTHWLPRNLYDPLFHIKLGECKNVSSQARWCCYCIISQSRLLHSYKECFSLLFSSFQPLYSVYLSLGNTWASYIIDLLYFGPTSIPVQRRVPNLEIAIPGQLTGYLEYIKCFGYIFLFLSLYYAILIVLFYIFILCSYSITTI